mgnify:FL=1
MTFDSQDRPLEIEITEARRKEAAERVLARYGYEYQTMDWPFDRVDFVLQFFDAQSVFHL